MNKLDRIALERENAKRHMAQQTEASLQEARESARQEIPQLIERLLGRLEELGAPDAEVVQTYETVEEGRFFKRRFARQVEKAAWFVCIRYRDGYGFDKEADAHFDLVLLSDGVLNERFRSSNHPEEPGYCESRRADTYDPIAVREGLELLITKYGA